MPFVPESTKKSLSDLVLKVMKLLIISLFKYTFICCYIAWTINYCSAIQSMCDDWGDKFQFYFWFCSFYIGFSVLETVQKQEISCQVELHIFFVEVVILARGMQSEWIFFYWWCELVSEGQAVTFCSKWLILSYFQYCRSLVISGPLMPAHQSYKPYAQQLLCMVCRGGWRQEGKHSWLRQSLPSPALLAHQDTWALWHGRIPQSQVQVEKEKETLRQSYLSWLLSNFWVK